MSNEFITAVSDMLDEAGRQFILMKENTNYRRSLMKCCEALELVIADERNECLAYRVRVDDDTQNIIIDVEFKYVVEFHNGATDLRNAIIQAEKFSFRQTQKDVVTLSIIYPSIWESKV